MKKKIMLIVSIFFVILALISTSYALLFREDETDKQSYKTGTLSITSESINNSVTLSNSIPMSNTEGANSTPYIFKITNTGNLTYKFNVMLLSTTTENQISSSYIKVKVNDNNIVTLNNLTNGVILEDITLKEGEYIEVSLRVWLSDNTPNTEIGKTFNAKIVTEGKAIYTESKALQTLTQLGLEDSVNETELTTFTTTSKLDGTTGIYKTQDDLGDSYYFRGNVTNNYVYFSGYYWRIIRINGDGTIRMIYDGEEAYENNTKYKVNYIATSKYNSSIGDNAYVGYMYGIPNSTTYDATHANTNDSTIKIILDNWYVTNIKNAGYGDYVADAIYCNDRKIATNSDLYTALGETNVGIGRGTSVTLYGFYDRVVYANVRYISITPTLKCSQNNDKFTVSETIGNGDLTYPIGLITDDEIVYAGGYAYFGENYVNDEVYLYNDNIYWTMTPFGFYEGADRVDIGVNGTFLYYRDYMYNDLGVRPVITLKADAINSGSGTASEPFSVNPPANSPNSPDLVDGLIPVTYNETTSSWVKADSTNSNNSWYDYDNKKWANAVLVTSTNRNTYRNASAGTAITESDILAFYVWIPRYKYKVWNIDKVVGTDSYSAQTTGIDIVFENEKESTGTINCTYSYATASSSAGSPNETCTGSNGDYYTHPAFTFGNDEVRGFWIGKYEVSSSNPSASNGGGESTSLTVRILPNITSWRYNPVSNQSTVIQNMQTTSNIYGLNTSRTNTDSHMLTNYEWGAVTYLTNSKYGRCTNNSCSEVARNSYGETNNYTTMTGCGPISSESTDFSNTCNEYNTPLGMTASTTGNVYGVYDMSGGSEEYVMGNMSNVSESYTFYPSFSGFTSSWYTTNTAKYVTTYAYEGVSDNVTNQAAYNRGRLGDATGEIILTTGGIDGWYTDQTSFLKIRYAWFARGGQYGSSVLAGIFSFNSYDGVFESNIASRAALMGFISA